MSTTIINNKPAEILTTLDGDIESTIKKQIAETPVINSNATEIHMTLDDDLESLIDKQIAETPALLYMKGTPDLPMCGYSAQVIQFLSECKLDFQFVNVLDPDIRNEVKKVTDWPTFPQLWLNGELVGGYDIMHDSYKAGTLLQEIEQTLGANQQDTVVTDDTPAASDQEV